MSHTFGDDHNVASVNVLLIGHSARQSGKNMKMYAAGMVVGPAGGRSGKLNAES